MHYHQVDDDQGDLVDLIPFCSDSCHRQWCYDTDTKYDGWDGAHENEWNETCKSCGFLLKGYDIDEH